MKTKLNRVMALAAAVLAAQTIHAKTLKVGDPAPKLQNGKWVQGAPVKDFEKGKAYIVEFWATWCGPCRVSIPHLNEIHNKYKDKGLVVIGQDCWERDESLVAPFVEKMGDKMSYRVALDDKSKSEKGAMAETWMAAAGRNGIPSAFLVDKKGLIAWIGHPMQLEEKTIEDVLSGKFDVQKAAAVYDEEQQKAQVLRIAWAGLNQAMAKRDFATAEQKIAELDKLTPKTQGDTVDMARFDLLLARGDYKDAYALAGKMSDTYSTNPVLLNELAWRIATDQSLVARDLELADKIATQANDLRAGKNPGILDTLARVKYLQGKKQEALALQEKAVQLSEGEQKKSLQATLNHYRGQQVTKSN